MADLRQKLHNAPWLVPLLIFLLLSTATLFLWQRQKEIELTARNEELNRTSAGYTAEISERLNLHAQFLRSVQAFASTSQGKNAAAWQTFSDEVQALKHLSGIFAFAYAPTLHSTEKASFTAAMRRRLNKKNFDIYPQGDEALSFPIMHVTPNTDHLKPATGFNLYSEPVRRQAIISAIDTGNVTLSGRIELLTDKTRRPGFALVKAVYRSDRPHNTVSERRAAIAGVVIAAYSLEEFLRPITRNLDNQYVLQLFDDGSSERLADQATQLLYTSAPQWESARSSIPLHHEIQFGERNWIVHIYPQGDTSPPGFNTPALLLFGGLLLSLLISMLVFHQTTHRQRAENYAQQLTAQLRKSEERFRLAATGTHDGLWDQNLESCEEFISPRMGEIFGFSESEMPQRMASYERRVLVEDEPLRRASLRQHLREKTPYDATVRIRQRDNSVAWIRIRGKGLLNAEGCITRLAGSVSDVTLLHQAQEELRAHRDNLQRLVDERTAQLIQALAEANQANQSKTEFLANMSHELRTPMHAIMSFSHLGKTRAEAAEDPKFKQYFERISLSSNRLLALINDLLDLSKLEAGKQSLELVTVNLLKLAKTTHQHLEALVHARHLEVVIDSGDSRERNIKADRKQMEQVFHNLLSNAIKFSPIGGQITLRFATATLPLGRRAIDTETTPAISFQVIDSGPGIPEDELESIFDKFYQSTLTKTGAGGTGLGLAICREIITQHHGTITAKNNPGGGAMLVATLPCQFPIDSLTS